MALSLPSALADEPAAAAIVDFVRCFQFLKNLACNFACTEKVGSKEPHGSQESRGAGKQMATKKKKKRRGKKTRKYKIDLGELQSIIEATPQRALSEDEHKKLVESHQLLAELVLPELQDESSAAVLGDDEEPDGQAKDDKPVKRKGGGGRRKRDAFKNAKVVKVAHPEITSGQACSCGCGKLYRLKNPGHFRHFVGQVPIQVTLYEREQYRCSGCEKVHTAPLPEGVGPDSYDATAVSSIAVNKYGIGLPFYRQEKNLTALGVPIAASTQCEVVAKALPKLQPVYDYLYHLAAQGELAYYDDTSMKILDLVRSKKHEKRTGVFTTGLLSVHDAFKIALVFTGTSHAGENRAELLKLRAPDLPAMKRMSDALALNFVDQETDDDVVAKCLIHGRRNFVKIIGSFPSDCRLVIEAIGTIYHHDSQSKEAGHDDAQRLAFHQEKSTPVMDKLKEWLDSQFPSKKVEPNSSLGKAITYLRNHWKELTLFLRVPGIPLDNNAAERLIKKVVLHRKNSLFYRTAKGAKMGDIYMSLIQTCQYSGASPFDYLTALQRHHLVVASNPEEWLPWNYEQTLEQMRTPESGPASGSATSGYPPSGKPSPLPRAVLAITGA